MMTESRRSKILSIFKATRFSFLGLGVSLFLLEAFFYLMLWLPLPDQLRGILSIPFVYVLPGCLILLAIAKNSIDNVEFLLEGFTASIFLGAGISLLLGYLLGKISWIFLTSAIIMISLLSLVVVWRGKRSRENYVLLNKYSSMAVALVVTYFAALVVFYTIKAPVPPSDSARYFEAAQNYIRSFSFSPYPPYPLKIPEVGWANLGGAIDFRVLWVVIVGVHSLVAQSSSFIMTRILNLALTALLVLTTFYLGSLVKDRKLGLLAAFFTALNPGLLFFAPYEVPYICMVLFALVAYSIYISAVGGERKHFRRAFLALSLLFAAFMLHVTVLFFALLLLLHFLYVVFRHGRKLTKILLIIVIAAFGYVGSRYLLIYLSPRFAQFVTTDLATILQTIYFVLLNPIFLTVPIWILFIAGIALTIAHRKQHNPLWLMNLAITLLSLASFVIVFAIFRFGVSFRFYLILFPLVITIAADGLLEDAKGYKRDIVFLGILFFALVLYLSTLMPFTIIFPFGIVTLNEVYMTFVPAAIVLVLKVLWRESFRSRGFSILKVQVDLRHVVSSLMIITVIIATLSTLFVYTFNAGIGVFLNPLENGLEEAGKWADENIPAGSVLATNAWTHFGLYVNYTRTPIVPFPPTSVAFSRWMYEGKVDYLVIFNNTNLSNEITWFHIFDYLKKYGNPNQGPPPGTAEFHRSQNFVIFKALNSYGITSTGVRSHMSENSEIWTLENGYVQLDMTRSDILFSSVLIDQRIPTSMLDFSDTDIVDGTSSEKLGSFDSAQWFDHAKNDWENWTNTSQPPSSSMFLQQTRARLSWNKGNLTVYVQVTVERGKRFGQIQWTLFSSENAALSIVPSIKPVANLDRVYIPSSNPGNWNTNSTLTGNPANESVFGLGCVISRTPNVMLSKGNYRGASLPSGVLVPEKTNLGAVQAFAYEFILDNEADYTQWSQIEVYVPDRLIDQDNDGYYSVLLQSYNINESAWYSFAAWDILDAGNKAASYGAWVDSIRATLVDGSILSDALGYEESYFKGVGLYEMGKRGLTVNLIPGDMRIRSDAPANITYSEDYGLISRLGFAMHMPGNLGVTGRNQIRLRLLVSFDENTPTTFEFSNTTNPHYGLGSLSKPFVWLYNVEESMPSMGMAFDKKPSTLYLTVNGWFNYTNLRFGYSFSGNASENRQFYTNLISNDELNLLDRNLEGIPKTFEVSQGDTALFSALSSLAYYNFNITELENLVTLGLEKSKISNEFNAEPIYVVSVEETLTWVSGGDYLRNINDNDMIFDVSKASSLTLKLQPKAVDPDGEIIEQSYDATQNLLKFRVVSAYAQRELLGTTIIYLPRRIVIYSPTSLRPVEGYVNSKMHQWTYDESRGLLQITIDQFAEAEVTIAFTGS